MKNKYHFLFTAVAALSILFFALVRDSGIVEDKNDSRNSLQPHAHSQGGRDNPFAAADYRYYMLATTAESKGQYVDVSYYRKMAKEYAQENNLIAGTDNSGISWVQIGPGNIGGRIRSILILSDRELLVGAVAGGIWKTSNFGANWYPVLDDESPISISSMMQVYVDSLRTYHYYAGTGEAWGNLDAVYGGGIFKSTNFGDTWEFLSGTSGDEFRNIVKLDWDTAGYLYAATKTYDIKHGVGSYTFDGGLYRTSDDGTSWTRISPTDVSSNYFNPCDLVVVTPLEILYAVNATSTDWGGIYRTGDGGASWTKITAGLPADGYGRIALKRNPENSIADGFDDGEIIYAVFESSDKSKAGDAGLKGIYRSTDKGVTWTALSDPPRIPSTDTMSYLGSQGWYNNYIEVDPFDKENLFVGGVDIMHSTNTGASWTQKTYWNSFYGSPVVHADHHAMAFDTWKEGIVYCANDGGIYKSTDKGVTWTDLNNDLAITQFYSGAVYKTGEVYYGGTQDNGHLKYSSGTDWTMVYGGDGGYSAVSHTDPLTAYEEYTYLSIRKTTNGGTSWASSVTGLTDAGVSTECLFIAPFSMSRENSEVLLAGSNEMWVTTNSAATWVRVGPAEYTGGVLISAVTIKGSASPFVAYAGTTDGRIVKCATLYPDSGTANRWDTITPPGNNGAYVRRIGISPFNSSKIVACYSGFNTSGVLESRHVWASDDSGATWTDISSDLPNIPEHSLQFDPYESLMLWLGTEGGVFKSDDYGASWLNFTPGMPTFVPVDELVLQQDTWKMFAFTHGRSVYSSDIPLPVELASFNATVSGNDVQLNWTTAGELNNAGFDIERNSGNATRLTVGHVKGNGSTSGSVNYSYIDKALHTGKYEYRLKQMDYNGSFKYYNLEYAVEVGVPQVFYLSQNYPNPFNPVTKIDFRLPYDGNATLILFDIRGREVMRIVNDNRMAGYYTATVNAATLSSGAYFYRLTLNSGNSNFSDAKKLVVLK